jgi:hypothetical protein
MRRLVPVAAGVLVLTSGVLAQAENGSRIVSLDRWWAYAGESPFVAEVELDINSNAEYILNVNIGDLDEWSLSPAAYATIDGEFDPHYFNGNGDVDLGPLEAAQQYHLQIHDFVPPSGPVIERIRLRLADKYAPPDEWLHAYYAVFVADRLGLTNPDIDALTFKDGDGNPLNIDTVQELVETFAPRLHFDSAENYFPQSVEATLAADGNGVALSLDDYTSVVVHDVANLHLVSRAYGSGADWDQRWLDHPGEEPGDEEATFGANPLKLYATPIKDGNTIAISYFIHYDYSNWKQFGGLNNHEGDWEGGFVYLQEQADGAFMPVEVAYSQHEKLVTALRSSLTGGEWADWVELVQAGLIFENTHPRLYVGRGGHASYFAPDDYDYGLLVGVETTDGLSCRLPSQWPVAVEALPRAPDAEAVGMPWLVFPGHWGQNNLPGLPIAGEDGPLGPVYSTASTLLGEHGRRWFDPIGWPTQGLNFAQWQHDGRTFYTLSASVDGGHGKICPTNVAILEGQPVLLTATPSDGYTVKAWQGTNDDTSIILINTVTMDSDQEVSVQFELDCNTNGIRDDCDISCGAMGGPCDVAGCGGSDDINLNTVPDECDVMHTLVLLDRTASMSAGRANGHTRCDDALVVAREDIEAHFVDNPNGSAAIWTFAGSESISVTGFVNKAAALAAIDELSSNGCGGSTPLAESICSAIDQMVAVFPNHLPGQLSLVISTDGDENNSSGECSGGDSSTGPPPSGNYDPDSWQQKVYAKLHTYGIPACTRYWSSFGRAEVDLEGRGLRGLRAVSDYDFFQDLAESSGGEFVFMDDDVPFGACCLPDGRCTIGMSESACIVDGGDYKGDETVCDDVDEDGIADVCQLATDVVYVDANATGFGDGTSWANAFNYLQDGLAEAATNPEATQVWVAAGTYKPDQGAGQMPGDRAASFHLINGVPIYGGFAGDEFHVGQRDLSANPTILSGDLNGDDGPGDFTSNGENSYHLVWAEGADETARLDGFVFTAGNANTGFPNSRGPAVYSYSNNQATFANCVFRKNHSADGGGAVYLAFCEPAFVNCDFVGNITDSRYGGGLYADPTASPYMLNCTFTANQAPIGGGFASNYSSEPVLVNCLFNGNLATEGGGALHIRRNIMIRNCTFVGNSAPLGGAIRASHGSPTVVNCVFWGNTAQNGSNIWLGYENLSAPAMSISYSLVEGGPSSVSVSGGASLTWGAGNIDTVPGFANTNGADGIPGTGDEDLRLLPGSPCIDAGESTAVPLDVLDLDDDGDFDEQVPADLDGNPRFHNDSGMANTGVAPAPGSLDVVDMGAYEFTGSTDLGGVRFVDEDAQGAGDGSSWANAYNHLQDALADATTNSAITQIWVAAGTYTPDQGAGQTPGDRTASFQLLNGVSLYGGFEGWEFSLDLRPTSQAFASLLSGDLAGDDQPGFVNNGENSYHVLVGDGTNETAVLDGFTITAGNANSNALPHDAGGGMRNDAGSPMLRHCIFAHNWARWGGGVENYYSSSAMFSGCVFFGNAAENGGGINNLASDPYMVGCRFLGNDGGWRGGGIFSRDNSFPTLVNCVFSGNSAVTGGAMLNYYHSSPTLINCTLSYNSADDHGGGIDNVDNSNPILTNCILWGNVDGFTATESAQINGGCPSVTFTCIEGLDSLGGQANIGDDPVFVDADGADGVAGTEDDDLRLQDGSPCINKGTNYSPLLPFDDIDAAPRIAHCRVDMGAYESPSAPVTWEDCNSNGVDDDCDVYAGHSVDANDNHVPDECDAPFVIGRWATSGHAYNIAIKDQCAYVADQSGLQVIDVSNPAAPRLIATYVSTSWVYDVTVLGDYAYVANMTGLQVINISNPATIFWVGGYSTAGYAYGVAVAGDYAFVADYSAGLQIIDIANPAAPVWVGGYNTSGYAYDVAVDVATDGTYAYVADWTAGLQVIDVSNPYGPSRLGGYNTTGNAGDVVVSGNYAYVSDYTVGLLSFDITDRAFPVPVGLESTHVYPTGGTAVDGHVYVGDYFGGLQVIDVSDPAAPTWVAGCATDGRASDVALSGGNAYVADGPGGVAVISLGRYATGAIKPSPGDLDDDGDVDDGDFRLWVGCMVGPNLSYLTGCAYADLDADNDVDLADFAVLQAAFGGH